MDSKISYLDFQNFDNWPNKMKEANRSSLWSPWSQWSHYHILIQLRFQQSWILVERSKKVVLETFSSFYGSFLFQLGDFFLAETSLKLFSEYFDNLAALLAYIIRMVFNFQPKFCRRDTLWAQSQQPEAYKTNLEYSIPFISGKTRGIANITWFSEIGDCIYQQISLHQRPISFQKESKH